MGQIDIRFATVLARAAATAVLGFAVVSCAAGPSPEVEGGPSSPPSEETTEETTEEAVDRSSEELPSAEEMVAGLEPETEAEAEERPTLGEILDSIESSGPRGVQPPDGVWLEDEDGERYFVMTLDKVEGEYRWVDEDRIRMRFGLIFEVLDHDEDSFDVKIYGHPVVSDDDSDGGDEATAAIEASYEFDSRELEGGFRLSEFSEGLPEGGRWRNGFDIGDMNGDGELDIVHGTSRGLTRPPVIILGDGEGGWTFWEEATFDPAPYYYGDAAVGDVDGDGRLDIALGMHIRGLLVLRQVRDGHFELWSEGLGTESRTSTKPVFTSKAIDLADWDGDGRLDLIAASEGPRGFEHTGKPTSYGKRVYLNQGDGSWVEVESTDTHRGVSDHLAVGDIDGDGRLDFVTASRVMRDQTILNLQRADLDWEAVELEGVRPVAVLPAVAVGDYGGDERLDIAVAYTSHEGGVRRSGLDLLIQKDDGSWDRQVLYAGLDSALTLNALRSGDLDGDGDQDLVGLSTHGEVWVFRADGAGGFSYASQRVIGEGELCEGYGLELVDIDRDERPELMAGFSGDQCPGRGRLAVWKVDFP